MVDGARVAGVAGLGRVSAVSPPVLGIVEVGDELAGRLALGLDHLLQADDLAHEHLVGLRQLKVLLLQGLDLVLRRREGLAQDDDLLRGGECILGLRRFPRRRGLSPDVVQVLFAVCPEFRVLELPCLVAPVLDSTLPPTGLADRTYVSPIGTFCVLFGVSDFVKVVFVELPHKAGKVAVFEMFG